MRNLQTILSFLTDTFGKLGAQFLSISFNDIVDIALLAVVLTMSIALSANGGRASSRSVWRSSSSSMR